MRLVAEVVVRRGIEETWSFLAEPANAPKWDRSIAATSAPPGPLGVGTVVGTTAPSGMRQSFQVVELEPPRRFAFRLLDSAMFRAAQLAFTLAPTDGGTRITHEIELSLRPRWFFLALVLRWTQRKALSTDLEFLRRALDEGRYLPGG